MFLWVTAEDGVNMDALFQKQRFYSRKPVFCRPRRIKHDANFVFNLDADRIREGVQRLKRAYGQSL